jgi:2-polyprenyl-6-hydroxyphenyl methylase/3-demethylubiquinone-9 3-methyltransferase
LTATRQSRRKPATTTVDPAEVARFSAYAEEWWDANGPARPLHILNPTRLAWIKGEITSQFGRDPKDPHALNGLSILDIGCGGGLVTEPMCRLGAEITGIDPSEENIAAARHHAEEGGLAIDYRATTAEALAAEGARFDVVTILEVVEHVADVALFIDAAAAMVKAGGLLIASTINRTTKAWLLAIIGAEYILRWLPRGTHSYDKLVTPSELAAAFRRAGLELKAETGVIYVPIADFWRLSSDMDVNFMMAAERRD